MINEGFTAALAARDATRNGDDSHISGTGARRPVTEGVVRLTQWFEKMEYVYSISNCTVACHVKFAMCTLQGNALTWWNSHVKTTTPEAAHTMPWRTLKKMMTDKYCPRGEIKKLEFKMWNLKVKGTDVVTYSQRFQELALICDRMFLEEIDQVEKYVGGLPDTCFTRDAWMFSYKTFYEWQPHSFKGKNEGVVGLKRWFKKIEQVFEICKCAEYDKVKFVMCTFEGRALTGVWNGNVQEFGTSLMLISIPLEQREKKLRAYAAAPKLEGKIYAGILPKGIGAIYSSGPCPQKCRDAKRFGHLGKDSRTRLQGKRILRSLACIKADEKKLDDIRVVRDFPEVFPDDLLGACCFSKIDLSSGYSSVEVERKIYDDAFLRTDMGTLSSRHAISFWTDKRLPAIFMDLMNVSASDLLEKMRKKDLQAPDAYSAMSIYIHSGTKTKFGMRKAKRPRISIAPTELAKRIRMITFEKEMMVEKTIFLIYLDSHQIGGVRILSSWMKLLF
ncbi:reverse transcriptase domain-containing protein [Tanacetum coccineum]